MFYIYSATININLDLNILLWHFYGQERASA